jgi:hypothetical protein
MISILAFKQISKKMFKLVIEREDGSNIVTFASIDTMECLWRAGAIPTYCCIM